MQTVDSTDRDIQILTAIRSGKDSVVFNELYSQTFGKIRNLVKKAGGTLDDAQDVFQDAVMIFYRQVGLGKYEHNTSIDAYIYIVAKNAWFAKLKKQKPTVEIENLHLQQQVDVSPEVYMQDKEREKIIMGVFSSLGERCKELLESTIYLGMSLKEVAEKMGYSSIDAVKTKNYKCKQRLVKTIGENKEIREILQSAIR